MKLQWKQEITSLVIFASPRSPVKSREGDEENTAGGLPGGVVRCGRRR